MTKNAEITAKPKKKPRNGNTHVKGTSGSVVNPRKHEILEYAKERIMLGDTMQQIADTQNISKATLAIWLSQLGSEYEQLRQIWIDAKLQEAENAIEKAPDQLELARAREQMKYSQWLAEMRDRRFVKQQQVTTVTLDLTAAINAGRARAGLTIEHEG